jgi:hypothetical protein|uniref:Uncharacterized protein n=1 Tax=viral metagenome TaxID=1070528 RepID=A0A6C0IWJ5_9ZZZZ
MLDILEQLEFNTFLLICILICCIYIIHSGVYIKENTSEQYGTKPTPAPKVQPPALKVQPPALNLAEITQIDYVLQYLHKYKRIHKHKHTSRHKYGKKFNITSIDRISIPFPARVDRDYQQNRSAMYSVAISPLTESGFKSYPTGSGGFRCGVMSMTHYRSTGAMARSRRKFPVGGVSLHVSVKSSKPDQSGAVIGIYLPITINTKNTTEILVDGIPIPWDCKKPGMHGHKQFNITPYDTTEKCGQLNPPDATKKCGPFRPPGTTKKCGRFSPPGTCA